MSVVDQRAIKRAMVALRTWGAWCRTGTSRSDLWESDPDYRSPGFTRDQVATAKMIAGIVARLPPVPRWTCQVNYVLHDEDGAPYKIVNRKLRAMGEPQAYGSQDQFKLGLERAICAVAANMGWASGE